MKINYTEGAIEDLKQLRDFIEAKKPAAADRYATALINGISRLKIQPQLGHVAS